MTRVNAALLAGVTTVLLFLATIGAVDWFMRAGGLFKLARLGHFLPILIASNSWMFVWLPIVLTQRRKEAMEQDAPLTPLPASKRRPRAF